jgi:hypothetical protein
MDSQATHSAASGSLHCLVGRSLPSRRHGAWIVDEVRGSRARLVTGDLRGEQWVWTNELETWLAAASPNNQAQARAE